MSNSKFSVEVELKVKIQGDRGNAGLVSRTLGRQFANALGPIETIIEGSAQDIPAQPGLPFDAPPVDESNKKQKRRKSSGSTSGAAIGDSAVAIDFKHEPLKFGNPRQSWPTAKKSMWLLYVVKEVMSVLDMPAPVIAKTFNKHFRQFGAIQVSKVTRDLGRLKSETPVPVQDDATKVGSPWYLTDAGIKKAQALVAEALTPAT